MIYNVERVLYLIGVLNKVVIVGLNVCCKVWLNMGDFMLVVTVFSNGWYMCMGVEVMVVVVDGIDSILGWIEKWDILLYILN